MSTAASEKQKNNHTKTHDLPSVKLLLQNTITIYKQNASFIFGYTSWLLIPLAAAVTGHFFLDEEAFTLFNFIFGATLFTLLSIFLAAIFIKATPKLIQKKPISKALIQKAGILTPSFFAASILLSFGTYLGIVLLIIPGILFSIWFAFTPVIVVLEEKSIIASFKHSKQLVQNQFKNVLWRHFAGHGIILFAQGIILAAIMTILFTTSGTETLAEFIEAPMSITEETLIRLVQIIFLPLNPIYGTLLYISLQER